MKNGNRNLKKKNTFPEGQTTEDLKDKDLDQDVIFQNMTFSCQQKT